MGNSSYLVPLSARKDNKVGEVFTACAVVTELLLRDETFRRDRAMPIDNGELII